MPEDVCAICLELIVDDFDAYEIECKHRFHGKYHLQQVLGQVDPKQQFS